MVVRYHPSETAVTLVNAVFCYFAVAALAVVNAYSKHSVATYVHSADNEPEGCCVHFWSIFEIALSQTQSLDQSYCWDDRWSLYHGDRYITVIVILLSITLSVAERFRHLISLGGIFSQVTL